MLVSALLGDDDVDL